MFYSTIFSFSKFYMMTLFCCSVMAVGIFSACKKDSSITNIKQFSLKIIKTGTGKITATWDGGRASEKELLAGAKIDSGKVITISAIPSTKTPNIFLEDTLLDNNTFIITIRMFV